jgi:hypothetical protein
MSTVVESPRTEPLPAEPLSQPTGRVDHPPSRLAETLLFETIAPERLYRFSGAQYDQLLEAGILTPDDKVELLGGLLVRKMGKYPPHVAVTKRLFALLGRLLPEGWHVAKEDPVNLGQSVPEPDLAALRGTIEDYVSRTPAAEDVPWIAEVSDTTYASDRAKIRLYAQAGIPSCWIINIPARRIEVYSDPTGPDPSPDYRTRRDFTGDAAVSLVIAGRELGPFPAQDLLPPA